MRDQSELSCENYRVSESNWPCSPRCPRVTHLSRIYGLSELCVTWSDTVIPPPHTCFPLISKQQCIPLSTFPFFIIFICGTFNTYNSIQPCQCLPEADTLITVFKKTSRLSLRCDGQPLTSSSCVAIWNNNASYEAVQRDHNLAVWWGNGSSPKN